MSFRHEWEAVAVREVHTVTYKDNKNKGKTITKELKVGDDVPYRDIKVAFDFHVTRHLLRHTYISSSSCPELMSRRRSILPVTLRRRSR